MKEKFEDGKLIIVSEGKKKKFINKVQQITFSAEFAMETDQNVLIVTERAVFKMIKGGLKLTEITPDYEIGRASCRERV